MLKSDHFLWCRIVAVFGVLAVAGCAGLEPPPASPRPNMPEFAEVELVHSVYFNTDDARLSQAESEALRRFIQSFDARLALDQIVIGHADVRGSDAHNDPLSERRAAAVAQLLEAEGFPPGRISSHGVGRRFPVAAEDDGVSWQLSRRVVVLARGVIVIEPSCPDWSRPDAANPANLPTSNFGCATAVNLIRMVADPRDLTRGEAHETRDGTGAAAAVKRHRADDVKPLRVEGATR